MESTSRSCKNCGTSLQGPFCHVCGERLIQPKDRSLGHFVEETFAMLFVADGKFPRTMKLLISRPGALTRSYVEGVRKKYLSPVQLFFFANLIYFLFPLLSTFNTTLYIQMNMLPYSKQVTRVVDSHLEAEGVSMEEFTAEFEKKSSSNAKLLLILIVVMQAIGLKIVFLHRKDLYFIDFLAGSAYFYSFYILIALVLFPLIFTMLADLFDVSFLSYLTEAVLSVVFLSVIVVYMYFLIKRAYGTSARGALWRSVILGGLMIPSFIIYRYILFWVTFLMVK